MPARRGMARKLTLKGIRYPYVRIRSQYYPLIPVTLHANGRSVKTFALIDSGASVSLFRHEIARELGLNLKGGPGHSLHQVKGRLSVVFYELDLQVGSRKFDAIVGFSGPHGPSFNLIGRRDFFDRFGVYFDEAKHSVTLISK